jgi:hypothetical protein
LIWLNTKNSKQKFYPGIFPVEETLYHLEQKNLNGTQLQIKKAVFRLKPFQRRYRGAMIESLLSESKNPLFSFAQNKTKFYSETSEVNYPRLNWYESLFQIT